MAKRQQASLSVHLVLICIALVFLIVAFHYRLSYWERFNTYEYGSESALSTKHIVLILSCQIIIIAIAVVLIFGRRWIWQHRIPIFIALMVSIICLALLEWFARIYICHAPPEFRSQIIMYGSHQCGEENIYSTHPYLNYYLTPNYRSGDGFNMHNGMGYRGPEIVQPKPPHTYRIVFIGGSSTYETGVRSWKNDSSRVIERVLQDHYNSTSIEVINAGVGAWTTYQNMINLEFRILYLQPDLIISEQGLNDLNIRFVNPQYYLSDSTGRTRQWRAPALPLPFRLTSVRILTRMNPRFTAGQFINIPEHGVSLPRENRYYTQLNGTPSDTLQANKPLFFENNLHSTIALARSMNSSIMFITVTGSDNSTFINTIHFKQGLDEMNAVIKKVGDQEQIYVYDYREYMPRNDTYWYDSLHVNDEGSKKKGTLIAHAIISQEFIDQSYLQ